MVICLAVAAVGTALVHSYQYGNDTKDAHEHTYLSRFEVVHLLSWAVWSQRKDSVYTRRFWYYSTAVCVYSPWMRAHEVTSGAASSQANMFALYTLMSSRLVREKALLTSASEKPEEVVDRRLST